MRPGQVLRAGIVVLCLLLAVLLIIIPGSRSAGATAATAATTATSVETPTSTGGTAPAPPLVTIPGTGDKTSQSEIERRLALPPAAYVAEMEPDRTTAEDWDVKGFAAFIDSATDTLITRTAAGSSLNQVAVAPDGSRVYMTDHYEPVLHVFDAETRQQILEITLPEVTTPDLSAAIGGTECSEGVACTPDGSLVLVCSNAGLQAVDTATDQVVRTLSDLRGNPGRVAASFDGERAYVTCNPFSDSGGERRLVCIDLKTWQIVKEIKIGIVMAVAVKPDDSQVFFSEMAFSSAIERQVRVVDALTLEDLWTVSTEPSFPRGIAFLPDGSKAYVVCKPADSGKVPTPEEYFCAVIDTAAKEIVKRIPVPSTCPGEIAVRSDGTKAYLTGGDIRHAVVIDTVRDVVIGDIGGEPVTTWGVAVRPFWWSTECLVALGLATASGDTDTIGTGDTSGGSETTSGSGDGAGTAGNEGTGEAGSSGNDQGGDVAGGEGGLSGGWIALIAVLAVLAVAALASLAYVLGRGSRGSPDATAGAGASGAAATTVAAGLAAHTPAFCSECGGTLTPGARFCPGCGRRL